MECYELYRRHSDEFTSTMTQVVSLRLDTIAKGGEYAKQQWEKASKTLEDRREQASQEGRGLAAWRWRKDPLEANERNWRDRMQLQLPI